MFQCSLVYGSAQLTIVTNSINSKEPNGCTLMMSCLPQMIERSQPVSPSDAAAAASSAMPDFPATAIYIQKRLILQHINRTHAGILPPNPKPPF